MKVSKAKTLILQALKNFDDKRPSKYDFISLIDLLKLNKVQITDIDFARSVINSLFEDKYINITGDKSKSNAIGIKITKSGISLLNEINKENKFIIIKLLIAIRIFWLRYWKIFLPIIIGAAISLFIHFDSKPTRKTKQKEKHTITKRNHINTNAI